jgi:hypothetical protein
MRTRVAFVVLAAGLAAPAFAQPYMLEDGNSSTFFNVGGGSQIGWQVDGVNQLFNQRFFYRVGGEADESPVDMLPVTGVQATDTNGFDDPRIDTLAVRHAHPSGLEFRTSFTLRGGSIGSGTADLLESINISNPANNPGPLSVSFFQYVDFDLGGTAGGDFGQINLGPTISASQSDGATFFVNETVVAPNPNGWQVGSFPSIVSLFGNGAIDNLNNFSGPIGPTDVTWAFQWNITLAPGQSFLISKDKLIFVPTPGAAALLGLGGLLAARRRR